MLPSLLYVSPIVPGQSGYGFAMRAGMVLQALTECYRVSLLVPTNTWFAPSHVTVSDVPSAIAGRCEEVILAPQEQLLPPGELAAADTWQGPIFRLEPFDVVHVFRLGTVPFAQRWLYPDGPAPRRHLDLDDVESAGHERLAALCRQNGDLWGRTWHLAEAERYWAQENDAIAEFDRVYVCSETDRSALRSRTAFCVEGDRPARRQRAKICALPNALPVPAPLPPRQGDGPFTFLFVGVLGYYPNEDAVVHFCRDVLPLVRRAAPRPVQVLLVGWGATPPVEQLAELPDVRLIGWVPEVAPWYEDSDAVVIPIRAGGGTRIKALEAFSYRRPVVTTTIGIDGIDAHAEEHVLIGDTPEAFAAHCLRLMTDRALATRLVDRAYTLFSRRYSVEAVAKIVATGVETTCAAPRPQPATSPVLPASTAENTPSPRLPARR